MSEPAQPTFESALADLEKRVAALESGRLPLEDALKTFEEGMALAEFCGGKLREVEQRVEILLKGADGQLQAAPFPGLREDPDADDPEGGPGRRG